MATGHDDLLGAGRRRVRPLLLGLGGVPCAVVGLNLLLATHCLTVIERAVCYQVPGARIARTGRLSEIKALQILQQAILL